MRHARRKKGGWRIFASEVTCKRFFQLEKERGVKAFCLLRMVMKGK